MANFDILKNLLSQAGSNIKQGNQSVMDQAKLDAMRLQNPEFQPSLEDLAKEQKYNEDAASAVMGSIAPIGKASSSFKGLVSKLGGAVEQELPQAELGLADKIRQRAEKSTVKVKGLERGAPLESGADIGSFIQKSPGEKQLIQQAFGKQAEETEQMLADRNAKQLVAAKLERLKDFIKSSK